MLKSASHDMKPLYRGQKRFYSYCNIKALLHMPFFIRRQFSRVATNHDSANEYQLKLQRFSLD